MSAGQMGLGRMYRELWRYAEGGRSTLVLAFALLLGSQGFKLVVPYFSGSAINAIQKGGTNAAGDAASWLGLVFVATVASWLLHGPGRILERNVALAVRSRLSAALMGRLFDAPLIWHEEHHSAETGHRVQQSTRALYDFAQSQFIYLQSAASLIGPVIALWLISPLVGGVAVSGYATIGLIIVAFDRVMMRLATRENEAERRYWSSLTDTLANVLSVFALRLRRGVSTLIESRLGAVFEPVKRSIVYNEAKWAVVDILNQALWILVIVLYAWQMQATAGSNGTLPLGNVFMVYEYALQAGGVITAIAAHFQSFARQQTDFGSAAPIWQAPASKDPPTPAQPGADERWRTLAVGPMTFRHPRSRGDVPTVREAELTLVRGRHYALIGPSGSGKTTLLRLLAGLYRPESGRLAADGRVAADPAAVQAFLRAQATLIPQEPELFAATVRENLALVDGQPDGDEVIRPALAAARADGFVDALPAGLDSEVAARGGNWSGGQRQRLALARGLLAARDSSLILLDEPTSALDPETEAALVREVFRFAPQAAIIASIHRPHLLDAFDEVVMVDAGRVVDIGPVAALAERSAAFRAFRQGFAPTATGLDGSATHSLQEPG